MKKKNYIIALTILIGMGISFITSSKVSQEHLSSISLANIEALALGEESYGYNRKIESVYEKKDCKHMPDGTYLVTTDIWEKTDCVGLGHIECASSLNLKSSKTAISKTCQCN